MADKQHFPPPSAMASGLGCRCPRCGRGKLYSRWLTLAERCTACGLDFEFADAGDGPAVFVIFILGFLVLGLVLWSEFTFAPPLWFHIAFWGPVTLLLGIGLLRPMKATLIALQFQNAAREGRRAE
ncbi:MAG: DUF983 domain-containing protein [Rhizobiales bacterium]|nr:DUF983 domain-containing protein [Hyphomicrobiales bacterium]